MHFGGDYNPEQWNEEVWHDDMRLMRETGVTMVSVGIFAWSFIQPPDEETFDFDWLDRIVDLLHENGIAVDMATATASPPPWATMAYPQMLPEDENGAVYWPGSRQAYSPSSPDYRRLAAGLVTRIAERYHDHPAVVLWHVNNEFGCHVRYDYSENAARHFRLWLRRRYVTIDALNSAWGTAFWSQRYGSFAEIVPPRNSPTNQNPAGTLDFKRFSSDTLLELYTMERDIIRAAGATQPITTNFMGPFPTLDYWKWAEEVDVISDDNYADPHDPESFRSAALARDLMRSFKPNVPWIPMEQATSAVNWRPTNAPKAPGQMTALSVQAIARGSDGIMFFQWRQSQRGSEKFHSAMLAHSAHETRTTGEVRALGRTLAGLPVLHTGTRGSSGASVAIVFDWESWWAISSPDHPAELDYLDLVQRWYSAFHRQHIAIDFVQTTSDLSGYDLVLLPHSYILTDAGAANLRSFVEAGAHLLVTAFSDIVDENEAFRPGGFQMGLRDVLGVTVAEFGALVPPGLATSHPGQSHAGVEAPFGTLVGEFLAEEIVILDETVDVIGRYIDGRSAGQPALTSKHAGDGEALYLATIPDDAGMNSLIRWVSRRSGVSPILEGVDEWVEIARRGDMVTYINHGRSTAAIDLPSPARDLRTDEEIRALTLDPFDWIMIR